MPGNFRLMTTRRAVALALAVLLPSGAFATAASARVPLPKPRPEQASPPVEPQGASSSVPPPAAEPAPPSACRLALTPDIAIAPSLPPIQGPGACGAEDVVRLEAVVLRDGTRAPLKPAAVLRCSMAAAFADWVRGDVAALAQDLGTRIREIDNFDSFNCRGRNRVAGARMSEHGRANAIDLRGIALANGAMLALTDRATPREAREKVLASACARFSTVLGPGSDGYHEDHIHLDLAERRSGYRICQWDVWEAWPRVATLAPAPRPDDAPARAVAAVEPAKDAAPAGPAQPVDPPQAARSAPAPAPAASPRATDSGPAESPVAQPVPLPARKPARLSAASPSAVDLSAKPAAPAAQPKPRRRAQQKGAGWPAPFDDFRRALTR
jgi:hypothetical protein